MTARLTSVVHRNADQQHTPPIPPTSDLRSRSHSAFILKFRPPRGRWADSARPTFPFAPMLAFNLMQTRFPPLSQDSESRLLQPHVDPTRIPNLLRFRRPLTGIHGPILLISPVTSGRFRFPRMLAVGPQPCRVLTQGRPPGSRFASRSYQSTLLILR